MNIYDIIMLKILKCEYGLWQLGCPLVEQGSVTLKAIPLTRLPASLSVNFVSQEPATETREASTGGCVGA